MKKKFLASLVILVLMLSTVLVTSFADTIAAIEKTIPVEKELKVFNPDENTIYAPSITYAYTIAPASGSELGTISDGTHSAQQTLAGIIPYLEVADTTAPANATSVTGNLSFTNAEIVTASSTGALNKKTFNIDFTNVVFTQPGIYRYKITESSTSYGTSGVVDGNGNSANILYLDIYVRRSSAYTNGNTATQWEIYGKIFSRNTEFSNKTTGFIEIKSADGSSITTNADEYHTFNVTVGKTLSGDATMNGNKFPFVISFANTSATGTFQFAVETTNEVAVTKGTVSGKPDTVGGANAVNTASKDGSPSIANGGSVKYIGIPCGTTVTVTERNNVSGTTYATTAKDNDTDVAFVVDGNNKSSGSSASTNNKKLFLDYDETAVYAQSSAASDDTNVAIQFTNTLETISPTGIISRIAPYLLIFALCSALLVFVLRRKSQFSTK